MRGEQGGHNQQQGYDDKKGPCVKKCKWPFEVENNNKTSKQTKTKETNSPLQTSEETQPCPHLDVEV